MRNGSTVAAFILGVACADGYANTSLFGYDYDVSASSVLVDSKMAYRASYIIPPSLSRSWCDGVNGEGVGEWLELKLKEPAHERLNFTILPGYAKSSETYTNNSRPKKILLTINDHVNQEIEIRDISREQSFGLSVPSDKGISKIKMTILEVYPGTKYEDTCITEVLLLPVTKKKYSYKESQREGARVQSLVEQAQAGKLEAVEELVRMSDGPYFKGAEGAQWLYEIYLDLFADNSYRFLFVTSKQNDEIQSKVLHAITNPVVDKYTPTQLLNFLDKGINQGIDASTVETIRSALVQRKKSLEKQPEK